MSLKVGELHALLKLDNKDFKRGVDDAGSKFGGLVGGVTKGGMIIGAALVGVGAAGGALAFKLAGDASDLNESINKVQVVFGDLGDAVISSMDGAAASMGMSKQAALEAAGTYGNLFAAMGIGAEENQKMSTGLVNLSADLASFNNMDPTQVLDALRSGLSGETEPLKRLGVNINQARLEAKAMEMGLWDGNDAIDAAAKAQATYALILEDTTLAQGDFARTSDGMANQQRIAAATFQDTLAALGQAALPIFESILPMLTGALQGVADWATDNGPAIQETLAGVFSFIGDAIVFVAENVIPLLAAAFSFLVEEVVPVLAEAFRVIAEDVLPVVAAAIGWIAEEIVPILVAAFTFVVEWISANWPTISAIVEQVAGAVGTAFGVIAEVIGAVWPVIEAIASVLFPLVGAAAGVLLGAIDVAFKAIGGVFEVLSGVARTVFDAISGVWDGMAGFFEGVWDGISGAFRGGLNALVDPINGFLRFLNNLAIRVPAIDVPFVGRVGGFGIDPFNFGMIPRLASGGRILRDGLALIGEEGPELMHMRAGAQVTPLGADGLGGSINFTIERFYASTPEYDAERLSQELGLRARMRNRSGI